MSMEKSDLGLADYRTIYVSGLPCPMNARELSELCREYGDVVVASIERDPQTGAPWGFGYVEFAVPETALRAARSLHGKRYRGGVLAARSIDRAPDRVGQGGDHGQ